MSLYSLKKKKNCVKFQLIFTNCSWVLKLWTFNPNRSKAHKWNTKKSWNHFAFTTAGLYNTHPLCLKIGLTFATPFWSRTPNFLFSVKSLIFESSFQMIYPTDEPGYLIAKTTSLDGVDTTFAVQSFCYQRVGKWRRSLKYIYKSCLWPFN